MQEPHINFRSAHANIFFLAQIYVIERLYEFMPYCSIFRLLCVNRTPEFSATMTAMRSRTQAFSITHADGLLSPPSSFLQSPCSHHFSSSSLGLIQICSRQERNEYTAPSAPSMPLLASQLCSRLTDPMWLAIARQSLKCVSVPHQRVSVLWCSLSSTLQGQ